MSLSLSTGIIRTRLISIPKPPPILRPLASNVEPSNLHHPCPSSLPTGRKSGPRRRHNFIKPIPSLAIVSSSVASPLPPSPPPVAKRSILVSFRRLHLRSHLGPASLPQLTKVIRILAMVMVRVPHRLPSCVSGSPRLIQNLSALPVLLRRSYGQSHNAIVQYTFRLLKYHHRVE